MNENNKEIRIGKNRLFLDENNILSITIVGDLDVTTAVTMKDAQFKLLNMCEGKVNLFVDNSKQSEQKLAAREIFKEMIEHEKVGKIAIFKMNPIGKETTPIFVGFTKNEKIQIFKTKEEALAWLKE